MPMRRAEAPAAMSRSDVPADTQWTRVAIAVALGIVFAVSLLCPGTGEPNLRTMLPELRVLAGVSCFVI